MNADCFRVLPKRSRSHQDGAGSVIRNSEAGGSADIGPPWRDSFVEFSGPRKPGLGQGENLSAVWQAGLRPNLLEGDVYETDIL